MTKRLENGKAVYSPYGFEVFGIKEALGECVDRLAAYEDTGMTPEEITGLCSMDKRAKMADLLRLEEYQEIGSIDHFRELAQAEKDGRIVVLPCKVGDVVYEANKRGFVSTYEVISIHVSACSILIGWDLIDGIYSNLNGLEVSALGKTVFLTREEAEAALKKREADDER